MDAKGFCIFGLGREKETTIEERVMIIPARLMWVLASPHIYI